MLLTLADGQLRALHSAACLHLRQASWALRVQHHETVDAAAADRGLPCQWLSAVGDGEPWIGRSPPSAAARSCLSGSPRTSPMIATAMAAPITGPATYTHQPV